MRLCRDVLRLPDVFTLEDDSTRLHAVPKGLLTARMLEYEASKGRDVLAIFPSALFQSKWPLTQDDVLHATERNPPTMSIPYSNHSSFDDLKVRAAAAAGGPAGVP